MGPRRVPAVLGFALVILAAPHILPVHRLLIEGPPRTRPVTVTPSDPYAWARLAHDRLAVGDTDEARRAVRRSLALGRWERPLIVDRLPVLARVAETPADHAALRDQMRRAWDWQRPRLLRLLPATRWWPLYRRVLSDDSTALSEAAERSGLFVNRVGRD